MPIIGGAYIRGGGGELITVIEKSMSKQGTL